MSTMKVTLLGLQHYLLNLEDDLFKKMVLPEGIDKDLLTDNILLKGSDFEVLYADPYFVQNAIGLWSKKWNRTFTKWVSALSLEYNPLENYDRKEDWSDTLNKGVKTSARRDSGNTRTFDNQDQRTLDTENKLTLDSEHKLTLDSENKRTVDLTDETEEQVSAFDSSSYQPASKTIADHDGTDTMNNTGTETTNNTGTETTNNTGTDTINYTGTITDEFGEGASGSETENSKTVRDGRIHGNIGVTTSQQMLQSELDIAAWKLYEHITDLFLSEFVIPIYS